MNAIESNVRTLVRIPRRSSALCLALGLAFAAGGAVAQPAGDACGELRTHYGPFDYRIHRGEMLDIVEKAHFDAGVESLTKPMTTTFQNMAGDVAYTLHAFPNHHRALITMQRLGEKHKTDTAPGARYMVECYFVRAVRFAPNDTVVRALYARYLAKHNRKEDAVQQLEAATSHAGENALSHFNIGLVYYELGRHDRALEAAHRARALGLQRTELADLLKRANKWQEPAG